MRPIDKGNWPKDSNGDDINYSSHTNRNGKIATRYGNARGELIRRIGEYCSYCEAKINSRLDVEHVLPKQPIGHNSPIECRVGDWGNFLLACGNCNSTKKDKDINLGDYFWPHKDNTFIAIEYLEGGMVRPAERLSDAEKQKAKNTIELTGLDKLPSNNPKDSDRRLRHRKETWDMAQMNKKALEIQDTEITRKLIVQNAIGHAHWSIWMTVFKDDPDMLRRFIEAFPGTCVECFDENDGYKPKRRH